MIISTMTEGKADQDRQALHQYLDMSNIVNSQIEAPDKSKAKPTRKISHDDYDNYIANSLAQTQRTQLVRDTAMSQTQTDANSETTQSQPSIADIYEARLSPRRQQTTYRSDLPSPVQQDPREHQRWPQSQ